MGARAGFGAAVAQAVTARPGLVLVAIALLTRLIAAVILGDRFYFFDETRYLDTASRLLAGEGFGRGYAKEPAYPILIAILGAPANVAVLRMAHATLAALGTLLIIELGRRTFGYSTGLAAGLLWALDPLLVVTSGLLYPESFAALVLVATILVVLRAMESDQLAAAAAAGFLLGVLTLIRAVAFVLTPVLLLWMASAVALPRRRRALHVMVVALAYVLVLAPWTYRNYQLFGRFVPIARSAERITPRAAGEASVDMREGSVSPMARVAYSQPLQFTARVFGEFLHFWDLYPTRLATDYPIRRKRFHEKDDRLPVDAPMPASLRDRVSALSFAPELLLAIAGVAIAWRRRRRETMLLAGAILAYAFGYALFIAKLRYRITILPELFVFSGVTVSVIWQWIVSRRAGIASPPVRRPT